MITAEDVKNKKPSPEGIDIILKRARTKNAIYVGDSVDDLLTAKNASIDFIGVVQPGVDKNKFKDVLRKNGAKIILDNINKINKVV